MTPRTHLTKQSCFLVLSAIVMSAHSTAIWDSSQPDQLFLSSVSMGDQGLLDVRLRMGQIQSWAFTRSGPRENRYDPATGLLTVAEVPVSGTTYYNVALNPTEVLSIGGWRTTTTRKIKVVGDSLADGGTFGYKLTVQGTASAPSQIWTDHIAAAVSAQPLCPRYKGLSEEEAILNPTPFKVFAFGPSSEPHQRPTASKFTIDLLVFCAIICPFWSVDAQKR